MVLVMFDDESPEYCATLEECSVTPAGANPLGELKTGFARLRGPLTMIEDVRSTYPPSASDSCWLQLRDHSRIEAYVFFDFDAYDNSPVLMITSNIGLVIRQVRVGGDQFVRAGIVQIPMTQGFFDDVRLSVVQLPAPTTITLL
jgi:hypothetical protein